MGISGPGISSIKSGERTIAATIAQPLWLKAYFGECRMARAMVFLMGAEARWRVWGGLSVCRFVGLWVCVCGVLLCVPLRSMPSCVYFFLWIAVCLLPQVWWLASIVRFTKATMVRSR